MKKSGILHLTSILIGLFAIVQLVSAWAVGDGGAIGDFSQGELLVNAIIFMMIAIWLTHWVSYYERRKE
jgi:hypothetical protein